jgi:uncharacterized protein (DUF1800 family)
MSTCAPGVWLVAALLSLFCSKVSLACDTISVGGFESRPADAPATDCEAARFLTQATFGVTRADLIRVREIGYAAWIDEQLAMPATLHRPYLDGLNFSGQTVSQSDRIDRWWYVAAYAPDQLRQRMAFALTQILVVSDQDSSLSGRPDWVADWNDLMVNNAFGNYRQLLEQVTYKPQMGLYLTYFRNRREFNSGNPPNLIKPDENYAREVMQLFSIGLIKRNNDFSPVLSNGQPVPTYDNDVIAELAKVFTGLTWSNALDTNFTSGSASTDPLKCIGQINTTIYHDERSKTLFDGVVLPALPTPVTRASCEADIGRALDALFNHQSAPSFISRQLIQRFVTSNPSPAYIQRVAQVFINNGSGVRGDLRAVVRAILLDPEARTASDSTSYGKLREPVLRLSAIWRAFNVMAPDPQPTGQQPMGTRNFNTNWGQQPLSSPTVFNFYEPEYEPPGPIGAAELDAPEFQILNESTIARMSNDLWIRTYSWSDPLTVTTNPRINITPLVANAISDPARMIEDINVLLLQGRMSSGMRATLRNFLATPQLTSASAFERARSTLGLVVHSPEFAIQR